MGPHAALILIVTNIYHAVLVGSLLTPHAAIVLQSRSISTGIETSLMEGGRGRKGGREDEEGGREGEREGGREGVWQEVKR